MDFQKIKKFFGIKPKKNKFYEEIANQKKQKYLFSTEGDSYRSTRVRNKNFVNKNYNKIFDKKDFDNKVFQFFNSYFHHEDWEKDLKHIMIAVGFLLIFLVGYIVVFSPYFRISANKVLIESLNRSINMNTVYRSVEAIYGQSIFVFDEDLIAKKIKNDLQNVESINISKLYPNWIKIIIKSLPVNFDAVIFGLNDKRWGISSNWVLIPISDVKDENFNSHLQLISRDLQTELFLGYKKILTDKEMWTISKIIETFRKEWTDLNIAKANYFLDENELHIILESNSKIIFSLHDELDSDKLEFSDNLLAQFVNLKIYIKENRQKFIEWTITYADARIAGKIFACHELHRCYRNLVAVYGDAYK